MTFRRVLESARTRLAPEAIWAAKQLEALDFIYLFSGAASATDFPCDLGLRLHLSCETQEGSELFSLHAASGHASSLYLA